MDSDFRPVLCIHVGTIRLLSLVLSFLSCLDKTLTTVVLLLLSGLGIMASTFLVVKAVGEDFRRLQANAHTGPAITCIFISYTPIIEFYFRRVPAPGAHSPWQLHR